MLLERSAGMLLEKRGAGMLLGKYTWCRYAAKEKHLVQVCCWVLTDFFLELEGG